MRARALFLLLVFALTSAACAGVLGIRPPPPKPFEHHAHLVKGVGCKDCHAGVAEAGEEDPLHLPSDQDCVRCHTKPHDEHPCGACHGLPHTRELVQGARSALKFQHDKHVPRVNGNCARCHEGVTNDSSHVRPPMALCLSCHEHQEKIATRECDQCHQDLGAERVAPEDHLAHDGDFLREHGARASASPDLCATCHSDSSCAACHGKTVAALPSKLAFDDPFRASVHRAGFVSRHGAEASAQAGLCSTCHAVETCERYHLARDVHANAKGKSPHPPGWLGLRGERNEHGRAAWRDPVECASCHGGAGEALCVGCHKIGGVGGNPHKPGWRSTLRKTDPGCRACHEGGR